MSGTERISFIEFNDRLLASVLHDAGERDLVIFCHGFQSQKTGPSRFFVRAARMLAEGGISSLRFDQHGCGDSPGDSTESSFADWVETTRGIAEHYIGAGYRVALFGQSMGGSAAIAVAADVPSLAALVAWAPDPNIDRFEPSPTGLVEEGGQMVRDAYWREAHDARIAERLPGISAPAYLVFGTADAFVDDLNRRALIDVAQPHHTVDVFEGYVHSAWSYDQATEIIARSCSFLADAFRRDRER